MRMFVTKLRLLHDSVCPDVFASHVERFVHNAELIAQWEADQAVTAEREALECWRVAEKTQ
jgi:hypothetical protein